MNGIREQLTKWLSGVAALLIVTAAAGQSSAAGIGFCNKFDKNTPIIIQGASFVKGMVIRGQPFVVYPGKTAYDSNLIQGPRQITIYNANNPNMILLKITINFPGKDLLFNVRPNSPPAGPYKAKLSFR